MAEKYELQTVTDKPYNAETPLKALIGGKTPTDLFYIRNHFEVPSLDADRFNFSVNGEVTQPIEFSLDQLKIFPEKSSNGCDGMRGKRSLEHETENQRHRLEYGRYQPGRIYRDTPTQHPGQIFVI